VKTNAHWVLAGKPEETAWKILGTGKDNIKNESERKSMGDGGIDSCSSEQVHVAGCCQHGNEAYDSTKCAEFHNQMRTYWVLEGSTPWS
jgi:hypothetical protein